MAFTVQNDDGDETGANALISLAEFEAHFDDRGVDVSTYTDAEKEAAIVKATDYAGARWRYIGVKITDDTAWPRDRAYDRATGDQITGIPAAVKKAVAEYAYLAVSGTDLFADPQKDSSGRVVIEKSASAGSASSSVRYADRGASTSQWTAFPIADGFLKSAGLVITGGKAVR